MRKECIDNFRRTCIYQRQGGGGQRGGWQGGGWQGVEGKGWRARGGGQRGGRQKETENNIPNKIE